MTPAQRIAKVIRSSLINTMDSWKYSGDKCVIALSGGVDSCAVLAAACEVGINPTIVSYTPDTHQSTDYKMAKKTAYNLDLDFRPAIVDMNPAALERDARHVMALGYTSKVQVESLVPMVTIAREAAEAGGAVLFTGDQSDGYFALSRWATAAYDKANAIETDWHGVKRDTDPSRIDAVRKRYYEKDLSCSGAVDKVAQVNGLEAACFPFREKEIFNAFRGTVWTDVNRPRIKEPIKIAFEDWFNDENILVRKVQVNLHKGDSLFSKMIAEILLAQPHLQGPWISARGLYGAMARGDV